MLKKRRENFASCVVIRSKAPYTLTCFNGLVLHKVQIVKVFLEQRDRLQFTRFRDKYQMFIAIDILYEM